MPASKRDSRPSVRHRRSARLAQLAEAAVSRTACSGFESRGGYHIAPHHHPTGVNDMIERVDAGTFDVECDGCGDIETFAVDGEWSELMAEMKEAGWTKEKVGDDWEHYCPTCSADEVDEEDLPDEDDEDEDDDEEDELY